MYRAIEQIGRISQTALKEPHLFSYNNTINYYNGDKLHRYD